MVAYSPLGHSPKEILGDPELLSIAKDAGKTPSQVDNLLMLRGSCIADIDCWKA